MRVDYRLEEFRSNLTSYRAWTDNEKGINPVCAMADEQPPNPASPGSPDKADSASGASLDDALSEAASLVSDLSEDVGAPEASAKPAAKNVEPGSGPSGTEDLDTELANLERLVGDASAEVAQPDDSQEISAQKDDPPAVPDFMSDLTGPCPPPEETPAAEVPDAAEAQEDSGEKEPSEPTSPTDESGGTGTPPAEEDEYSGGNISVDLSQPAPKPDAPPKSDLVDAGTPGVVGNIPKSARLPDPTEQPVRSSADAAGKANPAGDPKSLRNRGLEVLFALGGRGVTLLETIDRPTAKLGGTVRQLIGWAALATLGTALIVFLLSLL